MRRLALAALLALVSSCITPKEYAAARRRLPNERCLTIYSHLHKHYHYVGRRCRQPIYTRSTRH